MSKGVLRQQTCTLSSVSDVPCWHTQMRCHMLLYFVIEGKVAQAVSSSVLSTPNSEHADETENCLHRSISPWSQPLQCPVSEQSSTQ